MDVIYSGQHSLHNPPFEVFNGEKETAQEIPARAENIKKSLEFGDFNLIENSTTVDPKILSKLHSSEYLKFLESACNKLETNGYLYPSVFQFDQSDPRLSLSNKVVMGSYSYDTYTPLMKGTYDAIISSASIAYEAALKVKESNKTTYALCRPPGHHAYRDHMGGYCYVNNAGVAAEVLLELGSVAILDVDVHHGNGTQGIFYERSDVLTVSIHANPNDKFPHIAGFESEIGRDEGEGYNKNIVLPVGTTNEMYRPALDKAIKAISEFNPSALVIALGVDTHESDPIGGFRITTDFYSSMSKELNTLSLPTVIVQEGGYNNENLGLNVKTFLEGFK